MGGSSTHAGPDLDFFFPGYFATAATISKDTVAATAAVFVSFCVRSDCRGGRSAWRAGRERAQYREKGLACLVHERQTPPAAALHAGVGVRAERRTGRRLRTAIGLSCNNTRIPVFLTTCWRLRRR